MNKEIDLQKLIQNIILKSKYFFKNRTFKYILTSVLSSLVTVLVIFSVIIYNKNIILDKIFQLRNEQLSEMINNEIASDTTLLNAEKLLESNASEKSLNEEKIKQEAIDNAKKVSQKSIVDIVRNANPAVVSIALYKKIPKYELVLNKNTKKIEQKENGFDRQNVGSGSGFVVSPDGMIVTNRHVVDAKNVEYEIILNNGGAQSAEILAIDPIYDVAIMKISNSNKKYEYLELGDSDKLNVGESVIAIGNALGEFKNSVSVGIVSGLSRSVTANGRSGLSERLEKVIQTDAAINPGNSGGPLIDLYGKVIGVNVATATGSQSVSFALPINSIKSIINSVKKTGKISRPYVGIRYVAITEELKVDRDLPVGYGILIVKGSGKDEFAVIPGSPAELFGILEGDIIIQVDGQTITRDEDFAYVIRNKKVGDTIMIKLLRNKTEKIIYLVLGEAK
ncbi:trypsin-like peptidase domain-containing protein [Candidatus Nomurabacteria bacterium]|nr:trypsin-like peptidase domain-containing protein [Candidatus Nomurabacteria bacterium]